MVPNLGNVLANWTKWFPHLPLPKLPAIFGLDPAGVVVEVGRAGDRTCSRASVSTSIRCAPAAPARCAARASAAAAAISPSTAILGSGPTRRRIYDIYPYGGFCEYMTAPQYALVKLPDNVTFEQAARFGYTGTSYGAMKKANATPGQSMLVDGISGTLGSAPPCSAWRWASRASSEPAAIKALLDRVKALAPDRIETHALGDGSTSEWVKVAHRRRRRRLHDQRARAGRAGKHHGGRLARRYAGAGAR